MMIQERLQELVKDALLQGHIKMKWAVVKTAPKWAMQYQVETPEGFLLEYTWVEPPTMDVFYSPQAARKLFFTNKHLICKEIFERVAQGAVTISLNQKYSHSYYRNKSPKYIEILVIWEDGTENECRIREHHFSECEDRFRVERFDT